MVSVDCQEVRSASFAAERNPRTCQKDRGASQGLGARQTRADFRRGDEAVDAYQQIAGFRQPIQEEILKRSGGDLSKIPDLVAQAQEGAFDTRLCGGAFRCEIIRDVIEGKIKLSDFHQLVRE